MSNIVIPISEYFKSSTKKAVVYKTSMQEALYLIEYFDNDVVFHKEIYDNNSLRYVEDAAENWALGIKKLDNENEDSTIN